MKRGTMLLSAAVLTIGFAIPANAEYRYLGSVEIGYDARNSQNTFTVDYSDVPKHVNHVRIRGLRSAIACNEISVFYFDGDSRSLFKGKIKKRHWVRRYLGEKYRDIKTIRFMCRALEPQGGQIKIWVDTGRRHDQ